MTTSTKITKHQVIICAMLMISAASFGQTTIKGKILDQHDLPLPFANVLLLHLSDSSLVTGTVVNSAGSFKIVDVDAGSYLLNIKMIGYRNAFSKPLVVKEENRDVNIPPVRLSEDIHQLKAVEIKVDKQPFEKKADRIIVNVQSSVTSAGSSLLEVLEKSPGILVNRQNNSISMNGKSGVLIMINGKETHLPVDAVVQMLDGMSASDVEKIELINSPPAKYDAEGNAGIINILIEENPNIGTNGNIGATVGFNKGINLGTNFNINHRSKNWNTFLNYSISFDHNKHEWDSEHYLTTGNYLQSDISRSRRRPSVTIQNLRAGLTYQPDRNTTISILLTGYERKWDMDAETTNVNTIAADSAYTTIMKIQSLDKWQGASTGVKFNRKLTTQQEISCSFDYLYYYNNNPSMFDNKTSFQTEAPSDKEIVTIEKQTPIYFKVAKLDYTNRFNDKFSTEAGVKGSFSTFSNDVAVERKKNGKAVTDPEFSNNSNLNEKILATYFSWNWEPGPRWTLNGGARYEFTDTYLETSEQEGLVDREFGNFFPNMNLSYSLKKDNQISLSYDRRITRPTYNDLAPFVYFAGPNTFVEGNLSLRPAISDGLHLSYQLKQWWLSLGYSYSKNEIVRYVPEYNANTNEQTIRSQNLKYAAYMDIIVTFPLYLTDWWEIHNNFSFNIYRSKSQHLRQNITGTSKTFYLNINNTFRLPAGFSVEVSGYYQSAYTWGLAHTSPSGKLNIGIKKELKNDAVISLVASDILGTSVWKTETVLPESHSRFFILYDNAPRSLNLTYTYKFGNKKLKDVQIKSASEAEQRRVE